MIIFQVTKRVKTEAKTTEKKRGRPSSRRYKFITLYGVKVKLCSVVLERIHETETARKRGFVKYSKMRKLPRSKQFAWATGLFCSSGE